jgi:hypothetical protein
MKPGVYPKLRLCACCHKRTNTDKCPRNLPPPQLVLLMTMPMDSPQAPTLIVWYRYQMRMVPIPFRAVKRVREIYSQL